MIRIALVEDEAEVRAQLQGYVQRHTRQYGTEFAVTEFADGMELLDDYRPVYDILFLDVEMKHLDGMETARRVRELDKDVIIVFITNMAQFVMKGYEVSALDFLVKPVSYYMFVEKMHKAYDRVSMREERSIIIKGKECIYKVHTTELIYIEVQNHSLTFHTMQGNYMCTGSLKKVEKDLEGLPFARCSSSYLLNLMHVLRIEKEHVIMDNKDELLLSRLKRQEFMEILTDYYGGVQ
mgnify:CR=1 FL=1